MNDSIDQDLDVFSDKKYWTLARRKLLSAMFVESSNWDRKELAKKIGKTERTVEYYLEEPTFQLAMARMAEIRRIQLLTQILKFREEGWRLVTKELMKRLDRDELSFKHISKLIEGIEKNFPKSAFEYLPENLQRSKKG